MTADNIVRYKVSPLTEIRHSLTQHHTIECMKCMAQCCMCIILWLTRLSRHHQFVVLSGLAHILSWGKPESKIVLVDGCYVIIILYLHRTPAYLSLCNSVCYIMITVDCGSTSTIVKTRQFFLRRALGQILYNSTRKGRSLNISLSLSFSVNDLKSDVTYLVPSELLHMPH